MLCIAKGEYVVKILGILKALEDFFHLCWRINSRRTEERTLEDLLPRTQVRKSSSSVTSIIQFLHMEYYVVLLHQFGTHDSVFNALGDTFIPSETVRIQYVYYDRKRDDSGWNASVSSTSKVSTIKPPRKGICERGDNVRRAFPLTPFPHDFPLPVRHCLRYMSKVLALRRPSEGPE